MELLNRFNCGKLLLNKTIGWILIVNYVSDFIFVTVSFFVSTISFVLNDTSTYRVKEICLIYTLPYVIKAWCAGKSFSELGLNQVNIEILLN